jgi:hypothetical protein
MTGTTVLLILQVNMQVSMGISKAHSQVQQKEAVLPEEVSLPIE